MVHVVLLIQFRGNRSLWTDFSSVAECCEYICKLYEQKLQRHNPDVEEMTYDISELYYYVDNVRMKLRNSVKKIIQYQSKKFHVLIFFTQKNCLKFKFKLFHQKLSFLAQQL